MSEATSLYRAWDRRGRLLYVGIARHWPRRWVQHGAKAPWFADVARVDVEGHPSREAALAAERQAIIAEHPLHNVIHARPPKPKPEPRRARETVMFQHPELVVWQQRKAEFATLEGDFRRRGDSPPLPKGHPLLDQLRTLVVERTFAIPGSPVEITSGLGAWTASFSTLRSDDAPHVAQALLDVVERDDWRACQGLIVDYALGSPT